MLPKLVESAATSHRAAITYPKKRGAGRKGAKPRKQRKYTKKHLQQGSQISSPFTEIWHNNRPLILASVNDIPKNKDVCKQCALQFPSGPCTIAPFDICLSHEERWLFPNPAYKTDPSQPYYIPTKAGQVTTRYYCISKACILRRFPYFNPNLIENSNNIVLKPSHKKLLLDQLQVQV